MSIEQQPGDDRETEVTADHAEAPRVPAGQDIRVGPDESDEPRAGAAEPPD